METGVTQLVSELQKKFGKEVVAGDNRQGVQFVSSGSFALDIALGGGYPLGRIVELRGYESSGKTTLALTVCRNIQEQTGKAVVYIDRENALDMDYVHIVSTRSCRGLFGDYTRGHKVGVSRSIRAGQRGCNVPSLLS